AAFAPPLLHFVLHIDSTPPGRRHLRCNLFVQLPIVGGFPIVEEQSVEVEERMLLAFYPSEKRHSSQAVQGDKWRIICSFGYLVPLDHVLPGSVPQGKKADQSVAAQSSATRELAI